MLPPTQTSGRRRRGQRCLPLCALFVGLGGSSHRVFETDEAQWQSFLHTAVQCLSQEIHFRPRVWEDSAGGNGPQRSGRWCLGLPPIPDAPRACRLTPDWLHSASPDLLNGKRRVPSSGGYLSVLSLSLSDCLASQVSPHQWAVLVSWMGEGRRVLLFSVASGSSSFSFFWEPEGWRRPLCLTWFCGVFPSPLGARFVTDSRWPRLGEALCCFLLVGRGGRGVEVDVAGSAVFRGRSWCCLFIGALWVRLPCRWPGA